MWRDKIVEAKAKKSISTKYIADYAHTSEKTITRMLKGETLFASMDLVLKVGEAVGLNPIELVSETNAFIGGEELAAVQDKLKLMQENIEHLQAERDDLSEKLRELSCEMEIMRVKLEHKEKIIALQEDVISLQNYIKNSK